MKELVLKDRIILYFDVLGYKNSFEENDFDNGEFLAKIKDMVAKAKSVVYPQAKCGNDECVAIKCFSDNVCIVFDVDKNIGRLWAKLAAQYIQQYLLIDLELLIRGSIGYGPVYINDDFVYGKGLITCVELESKAAVPRIILGHNIETVDDDLDTEEDDEVFNDGYLLCEKGTDEYWEIVYCRFEDESDILQMRQQIISLVKRYCKQSRTSKCNHGIIVKYLWLLHQFNLYNITNEIPMCSDGFSYINIDENECNEELNDNEYGDKGIHDE